MGIEHDAIRKAEEAGSDYLGNSEPMLGGYSKQKGSFSKNAEMRYLKGCLDDPEIRIRVESLMTRSMHRSGPPKKPGDVMVISEQGTFDKEGLYHTLIKYIMVPDDDGE